VQCSRAAIIALVFGLGTALSTSFISGYVYAKGPVSIPYLGNRPLNVAAGGGFLALILATILAFYIVSKDCSMAKSAAPECNLPIPSPATSMPTCGEVFGLKGTLEGGDDFLAVRTGPTTLCAQKQDSDFLHNGDRVVIRPASHGDWVYVKRFPPGQKNAEGWAHRHYIRQIDCPPEAPE
jgi:hypothetical protein